MIRTRPRPIRPSAGRRGRSLTLRARLIITTLVILTIIGVGIGTAAVLAVRTSLMTDLDAQLNTMAARAQMGPGPSSSTSGSGGSSSGTSGSDSGHNDRFNSPLRFLALPGQGDGTIAAVTDGSAVQGQIARAGQGQPQSLDSAGLQELIGIDPGSAPQTVTLNGLGEYRVVAVSAQSYRVVYGVPQDGVNSAMSATLLTTAVVVIVGVLVAGGVASLLITRALRPLQEVADTARGVAALDLENGESALDTRVPNSLSHPGTEVGDVGAALNSMLDHVDSALQSRYDSELRMRQFVADASHELRTPLAAIRGYADLTKPQRRNSPPQVASALQRIDSGALRMSGLIDDLLLLARLDAGREAAQPESVDLSALLLELVDDAHVTSPDHTLKLDLPGEPVRGHAVPIRAAQTIGNVLNNALVHTPAGTTVTVSAGQDSDLSWVRIADDGPGIDESIVDRVFDRFVRSGTDRSRSADAQARGGSSGLGLSIARALMEAMGGSISVESSPQGTVFELRFTASA